MILLRIYLNERERLEEKIVDLLRENKIAGATVFRGVMGYGKKSHPHTASLLRLSEHLPLMIEVIDEEEKIDAILPSIDAMIKESCLITKQQIEIVSIR